MSNLGRKILVGVLVTSLLACGGQQKQKPATPSELRSMQMRDFSKPPRAVYVAIEELCERLGRDLMGAPEPFASAVPHDQRDARVSKAPRDKEFRAGVRGRCHLYTPRAQTHGASSHHRLAELPLGVYAGSVSSIVSSVLPTVLGAVGSKNDSEEKPAAIDYELKAASNLKTTSVHLTIHNTESEAITDPDLYSKYFSRIDDLLNIPPHGGGSQDKQVEGIESEIPGVIKDVEQGGTIDIDSIMEDDADGGDAALARAERGRIAQIMGDTDRSIGEFEEAIAKIKEFEDRATISVSDIGSHAAALVVNDSMISYEPAGFERVMVYQFQALNFLMKGDLEAAGVEVRRANAEQELSLKAHQEELAKAEREAKDKGFNGSDVLPSFMKAFGTSKKVAGQVKDSFQNAYTFYISGVVHELRNEPNDAYIDYKKALEIAPKNKVIQKDVARLAKSLKMTDDIGRFSQRFPAVFAAAKAADTSQVEVIVLFEDGLVPEKKAISFPVPIPIPGAAGVTAISIPIFDASLTPMQPLMVQSGGKRLAQSEPICAIDALAVKAFEEGATAMLTRQIVRAAIKGTGASMATQYGGGLAGAAVSLYNVASEKADTRSWRSLPQNAQVVRVQAAPGQVVELTHAASGASGSITISSEAGKKSIIRATRVGSKLFLQHVSM